MAREIKKQKPEDAEKEHEVAADSLRIVGEVEKEYDLKKRTKSFAHRCVKFAAALPGQYLGKHISRQLIRSSTSVAANYRASQLAQSKKGFISKLSIVIEECDESAFWIEFVADEKLIDMEQLIPLLEEAKELTAIFIKARKTAEFKDFR